MRAFLRIFRQASVLASLLLPVLPLAAQHPTSSSLTLVVKLTGAGKDVKLDGNTEGFSPKDESLLAANTATLQVSCSGGADCTKVAVVLGNQPITASSPAKKEGATFQLADMKTGDRLIISHDTTSLVDTKLKVSSPSLSNTDTNAPTLGDLLLNPCTDRPDTTDPRVDYYPKENLMVVRVSPTGMVIEAPTENMDENDKLVVFVLADPGLASHLEVKRKSSIRTVGSFNIVGAGTPLPRPESPKQRGRLVPPCQDFKFVLKDFAPGTGEVEISVLDDEGKKQFTNSFDFVVDKLYHGMFSFGALRSNVSDKAFSLAPQGDKKIIVVSEDGSENTFYSVLFTPFIWGARDIEKKPLAFYHRLNPTFGVTVNDFSDNALVGVSLDLGAFVFTGGLHYGRVRDLSKEAGLKPGDPFPGEVSEIPTTKVWKRGTFLGVSIDFRAAVQLLQTLVSNGGK